MDMYQWVARRKGFTVSNIGYFVYVDGQHIGETGMLDDSDPSVGWMRFNTAVIPYEGDDRWVEEALLGAKDLLQQHDCPEHSEGCEHGLFIQAVSETLS